VVVRRELSAQNIPPLWAALLSVGFDDCPVPGDGDPGGEVSILSSTSKTATTQLDNHDAAESAFYVTEEQIGNLETGFIRFVKRLFGDAVFEEQRDNIKCLTFVSRVGSIAQERELKWNVVRYKEATLYVHIDSAAFPEGSRASFVELLEYAEDELECENVVICFPGDLEKRDVILKTFMFLGFVPMRPGHHLIPSAEGKQNGVCEFMYMGYIV